MGTQVDGGQQRRERSRDKIEQSAEFTRLRAIYPLQAQLLLAFLSFADDAVEAMLVRGDAEAAQESVSAMAELYSWLKNTSAPRVGKESAELFGTLVKAGVPMEQVTSVLQSRLKRGRGAPVSSRLPVLLALEQKMLHPRMSWMKLAMKFCQCGKPKHDLKCRERLRHQAKVLEEMRLRLRV